MSKSKCTKHLSVEELLEFEMSKKRTPLWREAHLEVKSVKNWRVRSIFGSWAVEKVHAVVARRTFEVKMHETPQLGALLEVEMHRCGTKHISKSKMHKTILPRSTFGSLRAVVARSTCRSQNVQNTPFPDHFGRFSCGFAWQAQGILHPAKSEQTVRVL